MIAIVDYGSGNVSAISHILNLLKIKHCVAADPSVLAGADRYILPGVGAFDATMTQLTSSGLRDVLVHQIGVLKKKVLGICVGMQIFANSSEEGSLAGFGWIPGEVRKIPIGSDMPLPWLPHMGWNSIDLNYPHPLFDGINLEHGFYFLHSYYFDALKHENIIATTKFGLSLPCAVINENILGLQFHPEKSHRNGIRIFQNFAELA
jgi:imidazole glycerol-phosphate synthase subunit HisH